MIVSRNWLRDYVPFEADPAEVGGPPTDERRPLLRSGSSRSAATWRWTCEVTSNRADWLGHLGDRPRDQRPAGE